MRRKIKEPPYVFSYFSLFFWRECKHCRLEFRREKGWRIYGYPIVGHKGSEFFVCAKCAKTQDEARRIITKYPDKSQD